MYMHGRKDALAQSAPSINHPVERVQVRLGNIYRFTSHRFITNAYLPEVYYLIEEGVNINIGYDTHLATGAFTILHGR